MAPRKSAPETGGVAAGLRENELRFIKAVFDNMTQKPDADWSKVAEDLNLKDAKCAKERFRQMSVRHGWRTQAPAGDVSSAPTTPVKGAGKKGVAEGRVTKRAPRTPRKPAAKKEETSDDEADVKKDEEVKAESDEVEVEN